MVDATYYVTVRRSSDHDGTIDGPFDFFEAMDFLYSQPKGAKAYLCDKSGTPVFPGEIPEEMYNEYRRYRLDKAGEEDE